jgi:hypothetical protein
VKIYHSKFTPLYHALTTRYAWQTPSKGDRIERIFAYRAMFYFVQLFQNCGSSPKISTSFFHGKRDELIVTKKCHGLILRNIFQKLIWSHCISIVCWCCIWGLLRPENPLLWLGLNSFAYGR